MRINVDQILFTQQGLKDPSELSSERVIVYRSPSRISSMSYAGSAKETIHKSNSIPKQFQVELSKMQCKISLGTTGKEHKNAHVYLQSAEYLDGFLRICYLSPDGDALKVTEYAKRTRGSQYSSVFPILKSKLLEAGFSADTEAFTVRLEQVAAFVDIINEINAEFEQGKYKLSLQNDYDHLHTGYFNIVYFVPNGDEPVDEQENEIVSPERERSSMTDEEALIALDALIKIQNIGNDKEKKDAIEDIKQILERVLA